MSYDPGDEFTLDLGADDAYRAARMLLGKGRSATLQFTVSGKRVTGQVESIDMTKNQARGRVIAAEPLN
jgi:hypothetical protein